MALGPDETPLDDRLAATERAIDLALDAAGGVHVLRPIFIGYATLGRRRGITPEDWETIFRPRYLAAGWKKADWTVSPHYGAGVSFASPSTPEGS